MQDTEEAIGALVDHLVEADPGGMAAVALVGSAVAVAPRLDPQGQAALMLARDGYLGDAGDTWQDRQDAARNLAADLALRLRGALRATSRR
jgi:hypothetical protein